jgi:predicted AlkP superfamily pyrophosphatase or phosphodiesterase
MKRTALICVLLLGFFGAIQAADSNRHVVIISLDGSKPSFLQDQYVPNLRALWKNGSYTWSAQTVNPSVTLVAHASMLTGLAPAKHGVDWNDYKPDRGEIGVPTLFDLAHKAGLQTIFVGSKRKLRHLDRPGTASTSAFPRTELQETGIDPKNPDAEPSPMFDTVKAVRDCFGRVTPNLCFIHFAQPDIAGHKFGWESQEILYAVRQLDQQIGALLAYWRKTGFLNNTMIIVTSDHGGHEKTHGTDKGEDMTIPWVAWGSNIKQDYQIESPVRTMDTAATAAFFLKLRIPKDWDGEVVTEIFR